MSSEGRPLVIDSCPRCGDAAAIVRGPRTKRLYCADCAASEAELVAHQERKERFEPADVETHRMLRGL